MGETVWFLGIEILISYAGKVTITITVNNEVVVNYHRDIQEKQFEDLWSQSDSLDKLSQLYHKVYKSQSMTSGIGDF